MPAPPAPPASSTQEGGGEAASEASTNPPVNNLIKYLLQSLTQWQIKKVRGVESDASIVGILEEWKVTHEDNQTIMGELMAGQVRAHELSRQLTARLADLEDEEFEAASLRAQQATTATQSNQPSETPETAGDNLPPQAGESPVMQPAAKAGKTETAGSPLNSGGIQVKAPPPVFNADEIADNRHSDLDAGRDPVNRPIRIDELQSRGEVIHRWDQVERRRKERQDKEAQDRVRQDQTRSELRGAEIVHELQEEDKGNKVRPEIATRFRYDEPAGSGGAGASAAANPATTPSPTSPADEEEGAKVKQPSPFEELPPPSDSEVDVERELMDHPEWTDEVEQAGADAANWAENRNCSRAMQLRAASRARRKVVKRLHHESDKHARVSLDAGKRAEQPSVNDPLGIQQMPTGNVHFEKMPAGMMGSRDAQDSAASANQVGAGSAAYRPSTSLRRRDMPIGPIKKLIFTRHRQDGNSPSRNIRVLADGTLITEEEEALERAVTVAAELFERRLLPRRVIVRTPIDRPIERLSTDEILHFFPKDNYGIPKVLREGDNWLRSVIIKNLNEMLTEDEFIGRYLEPYGELSFTSLERFESHRVNACGRPKQYMIATFRHWMGAIRCLLAVNGVPRDPEMPNSRCYEVSLFNVNVDEVRRGPKINDGKRFGAECLAGNGTWHSRIPWRDNCGKLTYAEYKWW